MRALVLALVLATAAVPAAARGFTVTTPDFKNGGTIPLANVFKGFGCTGENQSPALSWSGEPKGTKSFAVTMYDPDAPTGSGWWHWTVFNIPADVHSLAAGAGDSEAKLPAGAAMTRTDFGFSHYGGPCPPVGDKPHHYWLTVYAVKVPKLEAGADSSAALLGFMLHFNSLAKTEVVGRYGRKK
jgi:Raf kinase inhibitor-like YbhB/YbcL family protein